MLLEISGELTPKRMKGWSQSKNNTQLWMWLADRSKVRCCKEQYCIGTRNVRFMNQGKLEVVKQEMARVNVDILGIREPNWSQTQLSRTQLSDFTFIFHSHALEKAMATHSSILAWRIPGTEEPGGLPSTGSHRVRHDWSDLAASSQVSPTSYHKQ